jgi:hypothetical protein
MKKQNRGWPPPGLQRLERRRRLRPSNVWRTYPVGVRKTTNFWYEKLSTEELVRRARESISCGSILRHTTRRDDSPMMTSYGLAFEDELVSRAEAVLVEHHLMHEYMLKSSK